MLTTTPLPPSDSPSTLAARADRWVAATKRFIAHSPSLRERCELFLTRRLCPITEADLIAGFGEEVGRG